MFGLEYTQAGCLFAERKMSNNSSPNYLFLFALLVMVSCTPADPPATVEESLTAPVAENGDAIDLIIEGDYLVTMDDDANVIADGALAIDGGLIIAMGTAVDINTNTRQKFVCQASSAS